MDQWKILKYSLLVLGGVLATIGSYERVSRNIQDTYFSKNQQEIRNIEHPREPIKHNGLKAILSSIGITSMLIGGTSIPTERKEENLS